MTFTVPEDGIFDDPTITVSLNQNWLSYLDGAVASLLQDDLWDGDDETVEFAIQQVRKLLARFAPIPAQNFWGNDTPDFDTVTGATPGMIGLRFSASVDGFVRGIRFYRFSGEGDGQIGYLFDAAGTELAQAEFPLGDGWVTAEFDELIAISANVEYMAAQYLPDGGAPQTLNAFVSDVIVGNLKAHASVPGTGGARNGTYCYCAAGTFPTQGSAQSNWFVDLEFVPG